LFILRYIDDVELRQAIEKQLNKIELANRFTRTVAVGNPREFTQTEKEEQEIAEACNRLIKNCIICWNYLYLSRQFEKCATQDTKKDMLRTITKRSPMSWAHVNMLGEYDFSDEKLRDLVGIIPPEILSIRAL
jgi:hypothetical protein